MEGWTSTSSVESADSAVFMLSFNLIPPPLGCVVGYIISKQFSSPPRLRVPCEAYQEMPQKVPPSAQSEKTQKVPPDIRRVSLELP